MSYAYVLSFQTDFSKKFVNLYVYFIALYVLYKVIVILSIRLFIL